MIKIILISLLFLGSSIIHSQNDLVVYTMESEPFYVVVNGVRQNYEPETNVKVTDLSGDFYKIRVVFRNQNLPDIEKSVSFLENRQEVSLELKKKKGKYKLKFAGAKEIQRLEQTGRQQEVVTYHQSEFQNNAEQQTTVIEQQSTTSQQTKTSNAENRKTSIQVEIRERGTTIVVEDPDGETSVHNDADFSDTGYESQNASFSFVSNGTMCSAPSVNKKSFLDFKYEIENANMFKREEKILAFFKENCMTASQVEGIIKIDYPTVDSKKIAKEGYRYTYDTENYGLVIQSLKNESDRQEVIQFLGAEETDYFQDENSSDYGYSEDTESQTDVAQVNYSLIPSYSGYVNCNHGQLLNNFDKVLKTVEEESFADNKMKVIKQAANNRCLKVTEIEKLAETFSFEDDKLELMKWAFDKTYDIDNFYKLSSLLSHSSSKEELDKFIDEQPTDHFYYVYSTDYSDGTLIDVDDLETRMKEESFADNKLNLAKQALASRYISVEQIKQLAPQFDHESDLLKFLEMAYPRTIDKDEFYTLNEILKFSSSKERLNEIMMNH